MENISIFIKKKVVRFGKVSLIWIINMSLS